MYMNSPSPFVYVPAIHPQSDPSGVTGGGAETSDWEISADLPGKKRQGKKGKEVKVEKKRRKTVKGQKLQNEDKMRRGFFFCLSLFKTTKICFGSTKMEIFYREKSILFQEKNQEKWLCPLRKIFLLRPWVIPSQSSPGTHNHRHAQVSNGKEKSQARSKGWI